MYQCTIFLAALAKTPRFQGKPPQPPLSGPRQCTNVRTLGVDAPQCTKRVPRRQCTMYQVFLEASGSTWRAATKSMESRENCFWTLGTLPRPNRYIAMYNVRTFSVAWRAKVRFQRETLLKWLAGSNIEVGTLPRRQCTNVQRTKGQKCTV